MHRSYEQWLNRIKFSSSIGDTGKEPGIITSAIQAAKATSDKKKAKYDIALVLSDKYRVESQRAEGSAMLINTVDKKFDTISHILFKSDFSKIYSYICKQEPNLDPKNLNKGIALGFIEKPKNTADKLGFL